MVDLPTLILSMVVLGASCCFGRHRLGFIPGKGCGLDCPIRTVHQLKKEDDIFGMGCVLVLGDQDSFGKFSPESQAGLVEDILLENSALLVSIHGGWGAWQSWRPCSTTCDPGGVKVRTRRCDQPYPSSGGNFCPGTNEDQEICGRIHPKGGTCHRRCADDLSIEHIAC